MISKNDYSETCVNFNIFSKHTKTAIALHIAYRKIEVMFKKLQGIHALKNSDETSRPRKEESAQSCLKLTALVL